MKHTVVDAASGFGKADLILLNGRWDTHQWERAAVAPEDGADDPVNLEARYPHVVIRGEKVVALANDGCLSLMRGRRTRVIDISGAYVAHGMTDSHTHIIGGGLLLGRLQLRDVEDKSAFVQAIADAAATKRKGEWVLGGRWSVDSWQDPTPPHRSWIDDATGKVPVFLSRMDGHQAFANSAALRMAGITADGPPDPAGGEIERDPTTREPTGILKESAMELVERHIPPPSKKELYEALLRGMAFANSVGVTSVHDMSEREHPPIFQQAVDKGTATVRIYSYVTSDDYQRDISLVQRYRQLGQSDLAFGAWLDVRGFKSYMDGSLGSRTAYMSQHYQDVGHDHPYPKGQLTAFASSSERFHEQLRYATSHDLQLAIHAIGDAANHQVLDAYHGCAQAVEGTRWGVKSEQITGRPFHRVEHVQHLQPTDIQRFTLQGGHRIVASMQPLHKADDGRYAERALSKDQLGASYAFRDLWNAGVLVCFGSDWPVVTMNPFEGMEAAITGRTLEGNEWLAQQNITVREALDGYTMHPHMAVEKPLPARSITAGQVADLIVIDRNPFARDDRGVAGGAIGGTKVLCTIVNGKVVFEAR